MILNSLDEYCTTSGFGIAIGAIYWLSMMFLSITFYSFATVSKDRLAVLCVPWSEYTCERPFRYLYPMDYSDPSFLAAHRAHYRAVDVLGV